MSTRIEKKYTFKKSDRLFINDYVRGHRFGFVSVHNKRIVHSIYFDTNGFANYEGNLLGGSKRIKARIRWYSQKNDNVKPINKNIFFELKIKSNQYGKKFSYKIDQSKFSGVENISKDRVIAAIRSCVPEESHIFLDGLHEPTLQVSYQREYYEDFSGLIRITVDDELTFSRPDHFSIFNEQRFSMVQMEYGVLETKISTGADYMPLSLDFSHGLIRAGRHSKYAVGMRSIYG